MDFNYVRQETVSTASAAARSGDIERLSTLLEDEENMEWQAVDNRGWGPLHHAAYMGQFECVKLLGTLENINLDQRTWEGETPLFLACKNLPHSKKAIHTLLKLNAFVNIYTNEQCSPLQYAAVKGDLEVVRWLVRKGARVNHTNVWGESAMHTTMKKSGEETEDRINIVRYLLKHEARSVCFDENNLTPLMLAAQKGFSNICEVLLSSDKSSYEKAAQHANLRAEDGATALMMAAQGGKIECVQTLLNFGADPNISADDGTYAVHLACIARQNSSKILELLLPLTGILNVTEACNLKEPDFMPKYPDKKVLSPFQLAIEWENYESLDVLVKFLDSRTFYTPLENCFLHKDLCPNNHGPCDTYPLRLRNPLGVLLNERISDDIVAKLPLFANNICDELSIPSLVTLLTSSAADPHADAFRDDLPIGKAFNFLVSHGATVSERDLLPILLFSSVSGIFKLIRTGLINPVQLIDNRYLDLTRQLLESRLDSSMTNEVFQPPLLAHRLLSSGIIATYCSLLDSDWVQSLAILVLNQLKSVLSIERLIVIDKMYKNLKVPKSLQEYSRKRIYSSLKQEVQPIITFKQLSLPNQLLQYLLYSDIDVNEMIRDYQDTIEHINDTGVSNIVHI